MGATLDPLILLVFKLKGLGFKGLGLYLQEFLLLL